SGAVRKTVTFRDAQVIFAASSERHERLGSLLLREGMVSAEGVKAGLAQVTPVVKLGQALVRQGALTEAALYKAMTLLVREVVLELFVLTEGSFLFLEGKVHPPDSLKLSERTR